MKKFFCVLFSLILAILVLFPLTGITSQAASLRNKKVVSVVYDDSGSMSGPNWAYANYAMQTFVAMLNEDDELYITYMSDENTAVKIKTDDLPSAVKKIRDHSDSGATPYGSVETAMKQLEKINDTNPNTQYWLVVFTDGGFNEETNDNVSKALDKFNSKKMANGSTPQILYMTIGDPDGFFTPQPSDPDITVLPVQGEEQVRDSLFEIASRVTGRVRVNDNDISLVDDHTISLSSKIPLLNMSILVQNKNVSIKSIKDSDNVDVPIKYEIPVKTPDPQISAAVDLKEMSGAVTLAGKENGNIASGKYTITFSGKISKEDIVIMLEPAVQLKIKLFIGNKEVTDTGNIPVSTKNLSAKADIYEFGTDNVIPESLLPGSITKKMIFSVDDKEVKSVDKLTMDKLAIAEGENSVRASLDISGYFHLETSVEFTPVLISNIGKIDAELSYDGSPRFKHKDGTSDAENVVYISDLKDNRTGIRFTLYEDGKPIDHAKAVSAESEFRKGLSTGFSNYTVEIQNDGSYLVFPSKKPWFEPILFYYLRHHGEQKITVTINGVSAEGMLDFKLFSSLKSAIRFILCLIGVLYIIWWCFFKKHFRKCSLVSAIGKKDPRGKVKYSESERVDLNWFGCFKDTNIFSILLNLFLLLLPMPSQTKFGGYTFSGQKNAFNKNNALLVRNVRGKAVDTSSTRPRDESQDSSIEMDETLYIRDGESYLKFYIEEE